MVPTGSFAVLTLAVPAFNETVAMTVVPFEKVTSPAAPPGAAEVTFAVSCTLCPSVDGLGVEVIEVEDSEVSTICFTDPRLGLKLESPG